MKHGRYTIPWTIFSTPLLISPPTSAISLSNSRFPSQILPALSQPSKNYARYKVCESTTPPGLRIRKIVYDGVRFCAPFSVIPLFGDLILRIAVYCHPLYCSFQSFHLSILRSGESRNLILLSIMLALLLQGAWPCHGMGHQILQAHWDRSWRYHLIWPTLKWHNTLVRISWSFIQEIVTISL